MAVRLAHSQTDQIVPFLLLSSSEVLVRLHLAEVVNPINYSTHFRLVLLASALHTQHRRSIVNKLVRRRLEVVPLGLEAARRGRNGLSRCSMIVGHGRCVCRLQYHRHFLWGVGSV